MTLVSGTKLGPYEIVAPLGAGGMGEVYRARDTRLGRDVAVKVLPKELTADAGRLRRFEQEARAASALQHPNILVVHDVGTSGEAPYLVTELLEGQTLRERLSTGPLSPRGALDIAIPVAQGLAAAHEKGIVHRDLKPENLFISRDGFVKILDFGIAKLVMPETEGVSQLPTDMPHTTGSGVVLGTVAYMSPEQASGRSVDARSDQFSLGTILYEMLAGRRPFDRETSAETLVAILREDPEALGILRPGTPPVLTWIVERCLAKDPADRYLSTRDLAHELKAVREHLSRASGPSGAVGTTGGAPAASRSRRSLGGKAVAAVVGAAAVLSVASFLLGRRGRPPSGQPVFTALTFRRGIVQRARFAPDGKTVIYSASWDGGPPEIFTTRPESPESKSLGLPPAQLLSVSSKGELAILLTREHNPNQTRGTLARLHMAGGSPRPLLENVFEADWSPDGEQLCVMREVGGEGQLEFPIGKVLVRTEAGGAFPSVSPRGDRVAFGNERVEVVDLDGRRTVLSSPPFLFGLAWNRRANEIWFTAGSGATDRSLHAVTPGGKERLVYRSPSSLTVQDISPEGRVLLTQGYGRIGILAVPPGETRERELGVLVRNVMADLSGDGRMLLVTERTQAKSAVFLRGTDGSPPVHLGEGVALALSPDQKWALCAVSNPAGLVELPTGPGEVRALESPGAPGSFGEAHWSGDGGRLFVTMHQAGRPERIYVREEGNLWRAVTPEGLAGPFAVSKGGQHLAIQLPSHELAIFDVAGGEPRKLGGEPATPVDWSADGSALFVRRPANTPAVVDRIDLATGKRTFWKELMPPDPVGVTWIGAVRISADERSYAYQYSRVLNELVRAEGLE